MPFIFYLVPVLAGILMLPGSILSLKLVIILNTTMKNINLLQLLFVFFLFGFAPSKRFNNKEKQEYYQITVYHFTTADQEKMLDNYLEKALLPSLHKNKFEHIGVFNNFAKPKPKFALNSGVGRLKTFFNCK